MSYGERSQDHALSDDRHGIPNTPSSESSLDPSESATSPPWMPFPDLTHAIADNPYILCPMDRGSATADFLWVLAKMLCGTNEPALLQARLDVLQERVKARMASGEAARLADLLRLRRPITCALEVGMTYIYFCLNEPSDRYPKRELLASFALLLLAESQQRLEPEPFEAMTLQVQAGLCLTFALSEETASRAAMGQIELAQESRKAQATKAAHASHRRGNERKEKLLSEYEKGSWQSIPQAVTELAPRHHFSTEGVIRLLREVERNRDSGTASPVRRRKPRNTSRHRAGALQVNES